MNQRKRSSRRTVLRRLNVGHYRCPNCLFLQTEDPYWPDEAYREPINIYDTGIMSRNLQLCKDSSIILYFLFDREARFLDYAGGYGIFTRLMRDMGFDFYWLASYSQNLLARGFEYHDGLEGPIEIITSFESFESFEHFTSLLRELEKMLSITRNILFTTVLLPDRVPGPDEWWYYAPEHGQHISFYARGTLAFMARKYGLQYHHPGLVHLLTEKRMNRGAVALLNGIYKWRLHRQMEPLLLFFIRRRLKSRTEEDMHKLLSSLKIP